jgi:hypothetical protein
MSDTYDSAQAETWTCPKCGWKYSSIIGGAVRGPIIHAYEQPTCVQDTDTTANTIDAKIAAHLSYLDSNAADCTKLSKIGGPMTKLHQLTASVYEEVAAELRNTLGIETP